MGLVIASGCNDGSLRRWKGKQRLRLPVEKRNGWLLRETRAATASANSNAKELFAMVNVHIKNFMLVVKPNQDEKLLENEVRLLEELLPKATGLHAMAHCTEIADLNRYQLINSPKKVMQSLLNYSPNKAFVFLLCSN